MLRIIGAATILACLIACSEESRNPLSPYVAGPMEGIIITPPEPISPVNGSLLVAGNQIALLFGSATSNSKRPFWYEIQLASDNDFVEVTHQANHIEPQDESSSDNLEDTIFDYTVPVTLEPNRSYWWHVRAADGAHRSFEG